MKHVPSTAGEHHQLDLSFVHRNGRTIVDRRLFSYPYVIMRTFPGPAGEASRDGDDGSLFMVVQNSSGPVHDRDELSTRLELAEGTSVTVTHQGASAVHRAREGNVSSEQLVLSLAPNSHLSYFASPRVYFPDAVHRQGADIELRSGSTLLYTDSFTVHDPWATGCARQDIVNTLTVRSGGDVLLFDRQYVRGSLANQAFKAFGSIMLFGLDTTPLPEIQGLYAAASRLPSQLGWCIRLAASDLRPLRAAVDAVKLIVRQPDQLHGGT